MSSGAPASPGHAIQELCRAIAQNTSYDAFAPSYGAQQWELFASYLQPYDLTVGQVLIDQGAHDRTLFFIESGALSVHLIAENGQMQLAILNPGSVVGEGSFFSRLPRSANVVATGACRVWRLTAIRFAAATSASVMKFPCDTCTFLTDVYAETVPTTLVFVFVPR